MTSEVLRISRPRSILISLVIVLTAVVIFVGSYYTDSVNYETANTELPSPGPTVAGSPPSTSIFVPVPDTVLIAAFLGAGIIALSFFFLGSRRDRTADDRASSSRV
jgi:hypothetical protein